MNAHIDQLTIPDRTLVAKGALPGVLTTHHLEEVRDYLADLSVRQDPRDYDRTLDQLHVSFKEGRMWAQFLDSQGATTAPMLVTSNGASQLANMVLPSRFFSGLKEMAEMDEAGGKIATLAWTKLATRHGATPRKVRTVRMKVGNEIHRVVRSCHSQGYGTYSNLEFVQDILDNGGGYADMAVLDWRVSDSGMRLRFAGCPANEIALNKPVPMLEAWNSEIGRRRVGLRGGMWKLVCTNGMGSWDERTEYNWIHRGDAKRIQEGVQSAFVNLITTASGVVDAYQAALDISIDNAFAWMEQELGLRKVPDRITRSAQAALTHPTTTPGGRLASVVDAITLVAQGEEDMFAQYEVERAAASILSKGRGIAIRNNMRIPEAR